MVTWRGLMKKPLMSHFSLSCNSNLEGEMAVHYEVLYFQFNRSIHTMEEAIKIQRNIDYFISSPFNKCNYMMILMGNSIIFPV